MCRVNSALAINAIPKFYFGIDLHVTEESTTLTVRTGVGYVIKTGDKLKHNLAPGY